MVIFQILDCYSQDLKVLKETEDEKQVEYILNDEDEYVPVGKHTTHKHELIIHLFGTTINGKSLRVSVNNFQPYFFVELPDLKKSTYNAFLEYLPIGIYEQMVENNKKQIDECKEKNNYSRLNYLKHVNVKHEANILYNIIEIEYIKKEKLYGYTKKTQFPFVKLSVKSRSDFYNLKKIFLNSKNENIFQFNKNILKVYEANLDPMLRFFHIQNIKPCGWVSIDCEYENVIDIDWKDVLPFEGPGVAPFVCGFWDIECYSVSGDFPLPEKDPVIQIGIVFSSNSILGEKHIFVLDGCDPLDGIIVHNCKTEKDMILRFMKLVTEKETDMLLGYNTFGFDMRYLHGRMEILKITENQIFQNLSRIVDILDNPVTLQKKQLSSSALGDNILYLWTTTGRLHIDLYFYIKRNESLSSYKLDDVCRHYMSGKLKGIDFDSETWFIKTSISDAEVGKYLVLLDEMGDTIVDKRKILEVRKEGVKGIVIEGGEIPDLIDTIVSWAIVKDDVTPAEIFRLHREGGSVGRAIVAKYCVQDCELVFNLYNKLDVFNNAMAMANTCSVPISYIFTRGQGIKCESLIFKECAARNQLIEVLPNPIDKEDENFVEESYEGAIVLVPEPNFYAESPIGIADFASLYPSTIYSENISYDTLLWSKDFDLTGKFSGYSFGSEDSEKYLDPSVAFTDIEFDIWAPDPADVRKNPEKLKTGIRICRYVQQADDAKGTLPDIVAQLLAARKRKRKEAEKENDVFKKALLDAEQLAYKLTANSLYGQLGSSTFKVRLQHLAASTTAYGRKQILFAKDAIETFYGPGAGDKRCSADGAKIVYGDSVVGDTPLWVRFNKWAPKTIRIDALEGIWSTWGDKDSFIPNNLEVWTEKGWSKVERVIRHKLHPEKKIIRVLTHTGIVDCTDDHSLVNKNGLPLKPNEISVGTELLHSNTFHDECFDHDDTITSIDEVWAMGFFLADGSSDRYDCPSGIKYTWAINKLDITLLERAQRSLPFETKIMDVRESSGVYKLVPVGNLKEPAMKYRELFYNSAREKCVPSFILNSPLPIVKAFYDGFYAGDGDKKDINGCIRFDQKGKEVGMGLYILVRRLGYDVSINCRVDKPEILRYTCTPPGKQRKSPIKVKKHYILENQKDIYVYDLQTSNHHFHCGPGALVVHNTDSLFVNFNVMNPETGERLKGQEAIEATMALTEEAGKFVTRCLKKPHDFEYDKVFYPFIIFSKKRYVGNKYEDKADSYKQTSMGIATKRRDYAGIVKNVYGGAIKILLNEKDSVKAFDFVKKTCNNLVDGKISNHQLTLTKSLRSEYKAAPAHKLLADRITARDPGNAPSSGDRMQFMYVMPPTGQTASKLQGDRIETPSFIKENGLKIDYKYYIEHQIYNPITQLFGLFVNQLPGYVTPAKPMAIEEKEHYAGELLFRDIYAKCDKQTVRDCANIFGFVVTPSSKTSTPKPIQHVQSKATKKKEVLNFPKLDRYLIANHEKEKKEKEKNLKKKSLESSVYEYSVDV